MAENGEMDFEISMFSIGVSLFLKPTAPSTNWVLIGFQQVPAGSSGFQQGVKGGEGGGYPMNSTIYRKKKK
jgi:hypothetical protein